MTDAFRRTTWLYLAVYLPIFLILGVLTGQVAAAAPEESPARSDQ